MAKGIFHVVRKKIFIKLSFPHFAGDMLILVLRMSHTHARTHTARELIFMSDDFLSSKDNLRSA